MEEHCLGEMMRRTWQVRKCFIICLLRKLLRNLGQKEARKNLATSHFQIFLLLQGNKSILKAEVWKKGGVHLMSCLIVLFLDCKNDFFPISKHDYCMRLLFWWALVIAVKAKPYGELKLILQNHQILKSWKGCLISPSSTSQAKIRLCYYILSAEPISDQVLDISCVETALSSSTGCPTPSWEESKELLQHFLS